MVCTPSAPTTRPTLEIERSKFAVVLIVLAAAREAFWCGVRSGAACGGRSGARTVGDELAGDGVVAHDLLEVVEGRIVTAVEEEVELLALEGQGGTRRVPRVPYGLPCLGDSILVRSFMVRRLGWDESKRVTVSASRRASRSITARFTFTGHVTRDKSSGVRGCAGRRAVSPLGARNCSGAHGTRTAPTARTRDETTTAGA